MKGPNINRTVTKLNALVSKRFGVTVEYVSLSETHQAVAPLLTTVRRNASAPMIVSRNELLIPMRVEGSLVGAARVSNINRLNPKDLSQIKDTIDLVLGESLASLALLDLANLRLDYLEKSEKDNVLPFRSASGHGAAAAELVSKQDL